MKTNPGSEGKSKLERLQHWFGLPAPSHFLGLFRIFFGLFMAYEMLDYFRIDLIRNMFVLPAVNFKYDFLKWLLPLPEVWMNILLAVLLACALAITAGFFFKWACRIFALGYAYIFLLDKSIYNNHIYLFILLAFLLSFTDADRIFSLRQWRSSQKFVPRWQLGILQIQMVIVYFYGGLAKLTYDWVVQCEPVRSLVDSLPGSHGLAFLVKHEPGVLLLSYGGLILDLLSPVLLWYKPVRKWTIWFFILFHLINSRIFSDIGIFPYVMLVSLILFYDPREIKWLGWMQKNEMKHSKATLNIPSHAVRIISPLTKKILIGYFLFQVLFPLRGHILPNPLDWTTIGNRFSWRMKVDSRRIEEMRFMVRDSITGQEQPVQIQMLVNDMQIMNLSMDPRSVRDFGKVVARRAEEKGLAHPQVYGRIRVMYNGRPNLDFIDPNLDLTNVPYHFNKKLDWVMPKNSPQKE